MINKMRSALFTPILLLTLSILSMHCAKRATQAATPDKGKIEIDKKDLLAMVNKDFKTEEALSEKARFQTEVIMPGDQISITLYEKLPVSQEARSELKRVDETGSVFLLPIGVFKIGGLNLVQAEKLIERKFSELVVSPHCEIQIIKKQYEPRIYIFGEVGKSGSVVYKPGDRLLDAISSAGGVGQSAYRRSIKVIRANKETIDIYSIDLYNLVDKGNIYLNMHLRDNDIVFVPRRFLTTYTEILGAVGNAMPWYLFIQNLFSK